jgi:hypothetical protein
MAMMFAKCVVLGKRKLGAEGQAQSDKQQNETAAMRVTP